METTDPAKPFIKKFSDGGFFYIYDVNTNQVIEVEKPVFDAIDEFDENDAYPVQRESLDEIHRARKEHGLFSSFRPKTVTCGIMTGEGVKQLHENGLNQIVLELSRRCTMNCAYCSTSGKYFRSQSTAPDMSETTCKKAVDFFCDRSGGSDKPFITFYGGEPLLRFDMIKETAAYVKRKYNGKNYCFNLTTNATLLNKEILDFFIEHDFILLVSLDGPKNVNDRYRCFKNGKGTFDRIIKNLELLRNYNREYYSKRVSISCVLSPPFDRIDEMIDFFTTNPTIAELDGGTKANMVYTRGTSFLEDFSLVESMKKFPEVDKKFNDRIKQAVLSGNLGNLSIEKNQAFTILYNLARKPITKLHDYSKPLGTCHIGMRRLFVNTEGHFYICERSGEEYKIGNLDSGFDYEGIAAYYRKLDEVLADCKNCWALSHCERCWVILGNLDEFTGEKKEKFCSQSKRVIENAFKIYTQLLRENPDCLHAFRDVVIA